MARAEAFYCDLGPFINDASESDGYWGVNDGFRIANIKNNHLLTVYLNLFRKTLFLKEFDGLLS